MSSSLTLVAGTKIPELLDMFWDREDQRLFFADSSASMLFFIQGADFTLSQIIVKDLRRACCLCSKDRLLLGLEQGLASFTISDQKLSPVETGDFNQPTRSILCCRPGPDGCLWIGCQAGETDPALSSLYRFDRQLAAKSAYQDSRGARAIAWSPDNNRIYYIENSSQRILSFDFCPENGQIKNAQLCLEVSEGEGQPVDLCVDSEGMLWIAHWGGNRVTRWDPAKKQLLHVIWVPASQVSAVCFGGKDLNQLFIGSSCQGLNQQALEEEPYAGSVFMAEAAAAGFHGASFECL